MVRKLVALAVVATAAWLVAPAPASAQPVDYAGCMISINPLQLLPGEETVITGTGLAPGVPTNVVLDPGLPTEQVLGTVTPDASGAFTFPVILPAGLAPGFHIFSVECGFGSGSTKTSVQVLDRTTTTIARRAVAQTGSEVGPQALAGAGAVVVGAGVVVASRRRRAAHAAG